MRYGLLGFSGFIFAAGSRPLRIHCVMVPLSTFRYDAASSRVKISSSIGFLQAKKTPPVGGNNIKGFTRWR
ncbi:hypothetical protein ACKTIJ_003895, partial [Enterobacter hormaechei]